MCIFAQPVDSVDNTQIFARLMSDGWQSLVYQMEYKTQTLNAMILPLPVALPATDEQSLEFISLKEYDEFFEDLNDGFPVALPQGPPSRGGINSLSLEDKAPLKVHDVGDFVASFVPKLSDFDRLDEQFRIPMDSWNQIPTYSDYGFAVFQLKALSGKPHPMAFRFRSRLATARQRQIFFPTIHIHDGEVHAREHFHHSLYLQAPEFDAACGNYVKRGYLVEDENTGYVRSKWLAARFVDQKKAKGLVAPNLLVHRRDLKGTLKNEDILAMIDVANRNPGGLPFGIPGLAAVAGVSGLIGLKWICDRRNTVASEQAVAEL